MTEKRMFIFKMNLILKDGSSLNPTRAVFTRHTDAIYIAVCVIRTVIIDLFQNCL